MFWMLDIQVLSIELQVFISGDNLMLFSTTVSMEYYINIFEILVYDFLLLW